MDYNFALQYPQQYTDYYYFLKKLNKKIHELSSDKFQSYPDLIDDAKQLLRIHLFSIVGKTYEYNEELRFNEIRRQLGLRIINVYEELILKRSDIVLNQASGYQHYDKNYKFKKEYSSISNEAIEYLLDKNGIDKAEFINLYEEFYKIIWLELPEKYRKILLLKAEGLTYSDIGIKVGLTEDVVYKSIKKIRNTVEKVIRR